MGRRIATALVALGLLQGIRAEFQVRALWRDKIALQEIVTAGSLHETCQRLSAKGL